MTPAARITPTTADPWREVSAARLPAAHLHALAPVRDRADVRVFPAGESAWVRWPADWLDVVRCLLPVPGVEFLVDRGGKWFRFASRLPVSEVPPMGEGRPVAAVLSPARFEPVPPGTEAASPILLRVVRGGEPKPATALACRTAALATWADTATTMELAAVRAARSDGRAVLLGPKLPAIPGAVRFWGDDFFVPVGFRPDPDLPPVALRAAVGATADELVFLSESGAELIPRAAFEPLTRAAVRLAVAEGGTP